MLSLRERVIYRAIITVFIKVIYRQIQINYRALTSFYLAFNNAMAETKDLDARAHYIEGDNNLKILILDYESV